MNIRNSKQWRTGGSHMLQSMGLQRVRHNLVSEQQQQQQKSEMEGRAPIGLEKTIVFSRILYEVLKINCLLTL